MKTLVTRASTYAVAALSAAWPRSTTARGFVTVRARMRLRPYHLARAASALSRAIAPFGGFAALVGPVTPTRQDASRGTRGSGLSSDVAPAA
jgi:hypothetical protein